MGQGGRRAIHPLATGLPGTYLRMAAPSKASGTRRPAGHNRGVVMARLQRIARCLWFDHQAEEAAGVLHGNLQELENRQDLTIRRGGPGNPWSAAGIGDDGRVRARRSDVHRAQRRPGVQVQRGGFPAGHLRDAGGDRLLLGCSTKGGDEKAQQCGWLKDKYGSPGRSSRRCCRS